jgi:MFS family permease
MVVTIGTVILADISTPARRGRMMSIYQGAFLFAVGIGPLPGGLLAERVGLSAPFIAYAIAGLAAGVLTWIAVPETRSMGTRSGAHTEGKLRFREQVRLLLAMPGFRLVSLVSFVNAAVRTGALFNVVPLIGAVKLGLSPGQIGGAFAVGSVLGLVASYPAGILTDHLGRKPVIVVANLFTAASMLAYCFAPDLIWFTLACLVWGTATAVSGAAPAAYAADSAPAGMNAAAMSSFRMLGDIGYVVGPLGLGLLVDLSSAEWTLAVSASLIAMVAVAFGLRAPETWRGRA